MLGDGPCHDPRGLDVLNEGAQIPGARRAAFRCAGGLLDGGEVPVEEARAGQVILVGDEARPEPGESVQFVGDEALERVVGALDAYELGMLEAAAQIEFVRTPVRHGDADPWTVGSVLKVEIDLD